MNEQDHNFDLAGAGSDAPDHPTSSDHSGTYSHKRKRGSMTRYLRTVALQLGILGAFGIAFMFGVPHARSQAGTVTGVTVGVVPSGVDAWASQIQQQVNQLFTNDGQRQTDLLNLNTNMNIQIQALQARVAALEAKLSVTPPVTTPPVTTPPVTTPPATGTASADGTTCTTANPSCTIVDAAGNSWHFSTQASPDARGQFVVENGVQSTSDSGSTLLISNGGKMYIKTASGTWWGPVGFTKQCGQGAAPAC